MVDTLLTTSNFATKFQQTLWDLFAKVLIVSRMFKVDHQNKVLAYIIFSSKKIHSHKGLLGTPYCV